MKTILAKDWNFPADQKAANKAIISFLRKFRPQYGKPNESKLIVSDSITKKQAQNLLGLPYTSSGDFAGLWVTNTQIFIDANCTYQIEGFVMGVSGRFYAYCMDVNENELLIPIR